MLILFSCGNKEKYVLEYNLAQGATYRQSIDMNMDLVQTVMNQEMKVNMIMNMKTVFDVKESRDDSYVLDMKFEELKTDINMPMIGTVSLDSNTTDDIATQANPGAIFKALINKPIETVMTKTGKIESVKGVDSLLSGMINAFDESMPETIRQQMLTQFSSQFSEEAIKNQLEQNIGYLPDKPVSTGESWKMKMETKASNFLLIVDLKSTLKSVEDSIFTIDVEGTVATPDGYEQDINGVKAKIILTGTQKGTLKLNRATGWVISSDITMDFNGDTEFSGMKIPIVATSKVTVTGE